MKYYCRLCGDELSDSNKCKAHIIPEFIWREYMKNGDSRESMILLKKNNQPPRFLRSYGIIDEKILCRKCDDEILGKIENDFKEVWNRVFKNGKMHEINNGEKLIGWAKEIIYPDDIIKTKLFLLCCIWRSSISDMEEYPLKINKRKEDAIKELILGKNRNKLPHTNSMICSKFLDESFSLNVAPFSIKRRGFSLIRFYLPLGYAFTIRLGTKPIDKKIGIAEFGKDKNAFFIANSGKFEGSKSEERLFGDSLKAIKNMYPSDKNRLKTELLSKYDDVTADEIDSVMHE